MASHKLLILPILVQVALTFALLVWLGRARVAALRRGEVRMKDIALGQSAWPDRITQISRAYANQHELPVLLYALAAIALATAKADVWLAAGAWLFVASRIVHAGIYVTSNDVPMRFRAFVAGVFILIAMWVWLAVRILTEGA